MDPKTSYTAHFADALDRALSLMRSHEHTTISVIVPESSLELVRLWGQPPLNGEDWP